MSDEPRRSDSLYDDEPAVPKEKGPSRWEDFIDIFYAPSEVFRRREHSGFFIPLLVVTVLSVAIFMAASGVLEPVFQADLDRQSAKALEKNPQMPPEAAAAMSSMGMKIITISVILGTPIMMMFTGLILWVCGKFAGAKQTLGAAMVVSCYAYMTRVVGGLVNSVQGLLLDPSTLDGNIKLTIGPGRFLDPDTASPLLQGLLIRADVFTIWLTVLLAIGLSVTGKIPLGKAAIAAAIVWLIGAVPALLGAL